MTHTQVLQSKILRSNNKTPPQSFHYFMKPWVEIQPNDVCIHYFKRLRVEIRLNEVCIHYLKRLRVEIRLNDVCIHYFKRLRVEIRLTDACIHYFTKLRVEKWPNEVGTSPASRHTRFKTQLGKRVLSLDWEHSLSEDTDSEVPCVTCLRALKRTTLQVFNGKELLSWQFSVKCSMKELADFCKMFHERVGRFL